MEKHKENNPAKIWWKSINYQTKAKFASGYIMPSDSPVDPLLFLDDETIELAYNDYRSTLIQDTIDIDSWCED